MRVEMPGWRITVPVGWTAVTGKDQSWLRFFFEAEAQHSEERCSVESAGTELTFQLLDCPDGMAIEGFAEPVMKRHVGQGAPERSARLVGGRAARAYSWTDGVDDIDTLFVSETKTTI